MGSASGAVNRGPGRRGLVIASTIGTTIEWYDFFLYGTAAGLVFGKLYFPNEEPLTATLAAFGTYFVGFIGRPIGAVPGPVTSAASAGCHRLLREFPATCVTSAAEAVALAGAPVPPSDEPFLRPDERVVRVLDSLRPRKARSALEIARLSGLAEPEVLAVLGPLELEGRARRGALGWTLG